MTHFRAYDHVERLGTDQVEGIDIGKTYIFPKLDGTNASIWYDDGKIKAGSRSREISIESDNHGFAKWVDSVKDKLQDCFKDNRNLIFYGEFLVKHTLGTYRDDAWRKFYLFDIFDIEKGQYLPFDEYENLTWDIPGLEILRPMCIINNPSREQLESQVQTNTYLIKDGAGLGEGIVIKNYVWSNRYGRQPWAKIVRNEFKEQNAKAFGITEKEGPKVLEPLMVEEFCTPELIGKTKAKIIADIANENNIDLGDPNAQQKILETYRAKIIPQLLGRVFHDLVTEEIWSILKKYGNATINFGLLQRHTIMRIKQISKDLF